MKGARDPQSAGNEAVIKVVQVCPRFFPFRGGIETYVDQVVKRTGKLGISATVYTTDPTGTLPEHEHLNGIAIRRTRSYAPKEIYYLAPALYSMLVEADAEIIHSHGYTAYPALAAALASRKNNHPLIFTPHTAGRLEWNTTARKLYDTSIGRHLFENADAVVAVSMFEYNSLKQRFGASSHKLTHIPNGVDVERFSRVKRVRGQRRTVLYVGRLERYKGIHFLIRGFSLLALRYPSASLMIVGSGPARQELISMAKKLGIQDKVSFIQGISNQQLLDLYGSAEVFVMLSRSEAFQLSLCEAMACGLPVISTRVGVAEEIIQPGSNGFLVDYPPSVESIAELISYVFESPEAGMKMGEQGRRDVISKYSWDKTATALAELYIQLA